MNRKILLVLVLFLLVTGCDNSRNVTGPEEPSVTYDQIKSNHGSMSPNDFATFISKIGNVEWQGTISSVANDTRKVEVHVGSSSNVLILDITDRNNPIIRKAGARVGEVVRFRAKITGFTNNGSFVLLGKLLHIFI